MIDDDPQLLGPKRQEEDRYGEGLLYDLGKFLTTLSLLAIGGVLTIADTADRTDIKAGKLIIVTVALALAAVLSASSTGSIAYGRYTGKPMPRFLHLYTKSAFALLGVGLGMFIEMWVDKLN